MSETFAENVFHFNPHLAYVLQPPINRKQMNSLNTKANPFSFPIGYLIINERANE